MPSYIVRPGYSYSQNTTNGAEQRFNAGDTVDLPSDIGDHHHALQRIDQQPVDSDGEGTSGKATKASRAKKTP